MTIPITMPALSPTMEEGNLVKWHIKVGDKVKAGDILAEIETDKATMEVEAVDEGVVAKLLVEEGAQGVKVNAVIAELTGEGETAAPTAPAAGSASAKTSTASINLETPRAALAAQPAKAETQRSTSPAASGPAASGPAASPGQQAERLPANSRPALSAEKGAQRLKASPLARRLASASGIDLSALQGSGPHGRIIKADLKNATPNVKVGGGAKPAIQAPGAPGLTSLIEPATLDERVYHPDTFDLTPLDGVRRVTAKRLTQSFMQVPHFPLTVDIEIDHLLAARKAMNDTMGDRGKISVNDMLIKASALALIAEPDANASYTDKGIARHKSAHVSVAVAIEGGLITPVVRDAQTKGLAQIAAEMKDLAARARDRKLKPQEYMGGTFSISNLGMFGIKAFASIINQPEGMILSVGVGEPRPVVKNGKVEIATIMTVTLTCDHRVVDGATGSKWLHHFRQFVETPEAMLL